MIEIARDIFHMTMELKDAVTDAMEPLAGIKINAYLKGTTTPVSIYQRRTGATEGPAPETAGTNVGPGTFVTGPTGAVEFWCEGPAELDIAIADTQGPARISSRTLQWNFVPAAAGSFPTSMMAADGGITLASLAADVKRQMTQIGQVIDWWRPQASVPIPSGWEICDGRQILAGQHDFAGLGGSNINLPDLRNRMILGAMPTNTPAEGTAGNVKAHGTAATNADAATDAPGIAGNGGSQVHALTPPQTPLKTHKHTITGNVANSGSLAHTHAPTPTGKAWENFAIAGGGDVVPAPGPPGQGSWNIPYYGQSATGPSPDLIHGHGVGSLVNSNPDVAQADGTAHNNTPRYFGLLKLMKVRYS